MTAGRRFQVIGFLLLSLLVTTSCTRPQAKETKATFDLRPMGKVHKQSAYKLTYLVIQARGQGISGEKRIEWDGEDATEVPSHFSLKIPVGSKRLIQVFAVYEDSANHNGLLFTYGDVQKDLNSAEENVVVSLSRINDSANSKMGMVKGRYLSAVNSGPTGILHALYAPPGKPKLRVFSGEMFGGWFETMAFKGIPLEYRMHNGELLFGQARELAFFDLTRLGLHFPKRVEMKNGQLEEQPAVSLIHGYFGPGRRLQNQACLVAATDPKDFDDLFTDSTTSEKLTYIGDNSGEITATGKDQTCTIGSYYNDYFEFDLDKISEDNFSKALGFEIPFKIDAGGETLSSTVNTDGNLVFNWDLLPGVAAGITGLELWLRDGPIDDHSFGRMSCHEVMNHGFRKIADLSPTQTQFTSQIQQSPEGAAILCTRLGGYRAHAGAKTSMGQQGSNGGDGIDRIAFHVGDGKINGANVCKMVSVELIGHDDASQPAPSDLEIALSASPRDFAGALTFHSDSSCDGSSTILETTISQGSVASEVYVTATDRDYYHLNATTTYGARQLHGHFEIPVVGLSQDASHIKIATDLNQAVQNCYHASVYLTNPSGEPAESSIDRNISLNGSGNFEFYDSPDCSSTDISGVFLAANSPNVSVHMKPLTVNSSLSVNGSATGLASVGSTINVAANSVLSYQIDSSSPNYYAYDSCEYVWVQPRAGNGARIKFPSAYNFDFTELGSNAEIFSDHNCTQQESSIPVPAESDGVAMYFKPKVVGGALPNKLDFEYDDGGGLAPLITLEKPISYIDVLPQSTDLMTGCIQIDVTAYDPINNIYSSDSPVSLMILEMPYTGNISVYSDSCITTVGSSITLNSGSSTSFWVDGTGAAHLDLEVIDQEANTRMGIDFTY